MSWFCCSLVLQVVLEPVGKRKVRNKVESVAANAASDALTTQLAQQARRSCEKNTQKSDLKIVCNKSGNNDVFTGSSLDVRNHEAKLERRSATSRTFVEQQEALCQTAGWSHVYRPLKLCVSGVNISPKVQQQLHHGCAVLFCCRV